MTDPREEIAQVCQERFGAGREDAYAWADAVMPFVLRERERAEAAEALSESRLALWEKYAARAERAEAALREAREWIDHSGHRRPYQPELACCQMETRIDNLLAETVKGGGSDVEEG